MSVNVLEPRSEDAAVHAIQYMQNELNKTGQRIHNGNVADFVRRVLDYKVFRPWGRDVALIGLAQHLRDKGLDLAPLKDQLKVAIERRRAELKKRGGLLKDVRIKTLDLFASKIGV
jgi:hypothetical protein